MVPTAFSNFADRRIAGPEHNEQTNPHEGQKQVCPQFDYPTCTGCYFVTGIIIDCFIAQSIHHDRPLFNFEINEIL
jgi:hypothetical protein